MSGSNPFRHSQKIAEIPSVADSNLDVHHDDRTIAAGRRFPALNIEAVPSYSRQKSKTVRIASPPAGTPISPESFPSEPPSPLYTRRAGQSGSSPPLETDSSSSDESLEDDPFVAAASGSDELAAQEEVLRNTRRNSAISIDELQKEQEGDTNAVRRTLARFSPRRQKARSGEEVNTPGGAAQQPSRPKQQLDVDAFKRLLLTGDSSVAVSSDGITVSSVAPPPSQFSESGSNTDTASISRQSVFETLVPPPTDTPRTSHEVSPEEADAELKRLAGHDEKKKPPPPKTRRGKLIKNDLSVTSPNPGIEKGSYTSNSGFVLEDRETATLDKPLPLLPDQRQPIGSSTVHAEPPISSPKFPKRPPTPPVTRRHSQRELGRMDLRSDPSVESFSQVPRISPVATPSEDSQGASPSAMKTPPVPPTRRAKRSGSAASSINQLGTSDLSTPLVPGTAAIAEELSSTDTQHSSPLPPLVRSTSGSSSISNKRISRAPGNIAGMPPPPPPPPPRRGRESSRSSLDSQRPSAHFLNEAGVTSSSSPRASGESNRNVSGSSQATDILADLAALQREVDELRQKQKPES